MNTRLDSSPIRSPGAVYERLVELGAKDPNGKPGFLKAFVYELYRIGALVNLNADWAVVQAAVETGHPTKGFPPFVSDIYLSRGNIGGIGVTDSVDHGYGFRNGAEAGRAMMTHLYVYVYGHRNLDPDIVEHVDLDPRWEAVISAGWAGTVDTVDDLSGKWASNQNYGAIIRSRFPAIIEQAAATPPAGDGTGGTNGGDMAITFGRVQHPGYVDLQHTTADKPEGRGWNNLGRRKPKFIAFHRMWGTLRGTDSHFGNPNVASLTDYGIGTGNIDGAALDGVIHKYNDPTGIRSGWASGPVSAPYGDGKCIVDKYGVNAVNRDGVSVETSGYDTEPFTDFAWSEMVKLCAYWIDQMEIPYNVLPLNPHTGCNAIIWHNEFTEGSGKECPFTWMRENTPRLYTDIIAYLKPIQEGATPQPQPEPEPEVIGVGDTVKTLVRLNLRKSPALAGEVVTTLDAGVELVVVAPIQQADGYGWLPVTGEAGTGFVAVGEDGDPYVEKIASAPQPEPEPEPELDYPVGIDKEMASRLFGSAAFGGVTYAFDENGPVSRLWLERGKVDGEYPALREVFEANASRYFVFGDGMVIFDPDGDVGPMYVGMAEDLTDIIGDVLDNAA